MSEKTISIRSYAIVLAALLVLTVLTVGVSFIPLSGSWHVGLGLSIAVVKATMVVLIFMHVLFSPRLTWIVFAAAILWMIIMVSLTYCDYLTRGLIPNMPGH